MDARPGDVSWAVLRCASYTERTGSPVQRREGPVVHPVIILSMGPRLRVGGTWHSSFLTGPTECVDETEHDGTQDGVQIDLHPLAARSVLGVPMQEVAGMVVAVEDVLGASGRDLLERVGETATPADRAAVVHRFVARRMSENPGPTPVTAAAWRALAVSHGRVRVEALAVELGCSRRYLAARFREEVGLPPKVVARLLRFAFTQRRLRAGGRLADVADAAGYADQAHLSRDFREIAGCTPTQFLAHCAPAAASFPFVQDAGEEAF